MNSTMYAINAHQPNTTPSTTENALIAHLVQQPVTLMTLVSSMSIVLLVDLAGMLITKTAMHLAQLNSTMIHLNCLAKIVHLAHNLVLMKMEFSLCQEQPEDKLGMISAKNVILAAQEMFISQQLQDVHAEVLPMKRVQIFAINVVPLNTMILSTKNVLHVLQIQIAVSM